jgi:competence protein ComEC
MRVHLIDVGQGAATLIEFSCGAVLVDTGGESNAEFESTEHLLAYLDAFFKRRPDLHDTLAMMLLTHPHVDHTRNAMEVWKRYKVLNVVTDGMSTSSGGRQERDLIEAADEAHDGDDRINEHDIPGSGLRDPIIDPVACSDGDPDIRVFWGAVTESDVDWGERTLKNANNDSVVVKFTLGKASLLVMGDLEIDGIGALLKKFSGTSVLDADVYEVGHHGSYNATTKELLDAITPKVALIAMGSPERRETWSAWAYGHPRLTTIQLLEAALSGARRSPVNEFVATGAKRFEPAQISAPIYATGWDGNVVVTMFADGRLDVTTHAEPN